MTCLWTMLPMIALALSFRVQAYNREPAVSGKFYPDDPIKLSKNIEQALSQAQPDKKYAAPIAILVPHAGYEFSAQTAAYSYKLVSGAYDTVVIFASAHTVAITKAALYAKGSFQTPLGTLPVDEALAAKLLQDPSRFEENPTAHQKEHSIEVQLPFLIKRLKPGFKILPILLNSDDPAFCMNIGKTIAAALEGKKALLVISSDLSHYPSAELASKIDQTTLKALEPMDVQNFWLSNRILMSRREPDLQTTACAEPAIIAGLTAAKALGASRGVLLKYANSSESPQGDSRHAVGYGAMAFIKSSQPTPADIALNPIQKKSLLKLARTTISQGFLNQKPDARLMNDPVLNLPGAVFVTLTQDNRLRGCIGTTQARSTLRDSVAHSAYSAAFEDHRFAPLTKEELPKIHIEVSLLSTARAAASHETVIPHKHGVILEQGEHAGLFLPQVWEQLPRKEAFLGELCEQKAGLPRDCWKDPQTKISVFTVSAFEEDN